MFSYVLPQITEPAPIGEAEAILVASGDLRLSANQKCWPAQEAMEKRLVEACAREGTTVRRGERYDPVEEHGVIASRRMGLDICQQSHPDARVLVAESVWQY